MPLFNGNFFYDPGGIMTGSSGAGAADTDKQWYINQFLQHRLKKYGGMSAEQLMGVQSNPQLASIYSDLQGAMSGPDLYSQNDVRNNSLAIQTGAAPGWRDFLKGADTGASKAGMQDSGFYGDYLNRAGAQQNAQTQGQIMAGANQMGQANASFRQQKLSDSMGFLGQFLQGQRKRYYGASQVANSFGMGGG